MSAHALLGPSSSKMWLNCPGSARLNEKFEDKSSEYAEEGRLAHEIAEHLLKGNTGLRQFSSNKYYNAEMVDHCKSYVEYVNSQPGEALLVEQRLDYSGWVPEGFGTGDAIKVDDELLNIIDLKYGKGVPVSAEDNPQLKFYALGAIGALANIFDFTRVKVHIFQPRLGEPTVAEYTVEEILEWAETIKGKAQDAWDGKEEYMAGGWCTFCKAKGACRTRMEQEAKKAFDDLVTDPDECLQIPNNLMTDEEVIYWLERADAITKFLNDLQDFAREKAVNHGKEWAGWKVVEGRSTRKYSDTTALITKLEESAVPPGYIKTELVGITEMEKILGKKVFKELVEPFLVKVPGKPTLVKDSDKRPALNSNQAAQEVFND